MKTKIFYASTILTHDLGNPCHALYQQSYGVSKCQREISGLIHSQGDGSGFKFRSRKSFRYHIFIINTRLKTNTKPFYLLINQSEL